ncbi:DAK2 domain-containing protein [Mycoplasma crocodyli]|uniref:Dihydroxyacetone (Glycerone) kinase, DhaK2 subunit n=1 Tax=Mycoplasma crocodyli (strain ATCC 51981 / MP145) TaxID=512564 RepID=D5E4P7_MYCCM|nr:DAK2 domain-containing protein [Mycoplasma crocodyli]ADE19866.1 dihydroxyacetone (glycerone) kinase, DhaK2 subunit [Mycoplasma crocodyli MP145]
MNKSLDGQMFLNAMISASNALSNSKNRIDALNVFPVPDGDTGTNMSSTINTAIDNCRNITDESISVVSSSIAKGMLLGARGNSGVILSQIFKGFSMGLSEKNSATVKDLVQALNTAQQKAYGAVLKPVEGTILTVIRETSEMIQKEYKKDFTKVSILDFFTKVLEFMRIACDNTPNKLKILREVGVTDSGGEGLFVIFEGMLSYFQGKPVQISKTTDDINSFINDTEVFDGEFGYCTEFIIDLEEQDKFDKEEFTRQIESIATSLVVVTDENILKVHGHTLKPGQMLNLAQEYGEFIKIKSENMTIQANNSKAIAETKKHVEVVESSECGIISCNLGSGIISKMKEYGCDYIVESGQTQNPSAQDLINAVNAVNAKTVFILPNNSNIILVSQQAAQVITDKNVIVIPSKTQIQGLSAILNFNKENSAEDNLEFMTEAIEEVVTGEVTKAVRSTKIGGVKIKEGEYISILKGNIISSSETYLEAAREIVDNILENDEKELITIYYGDEASQRDAEELANIVQGNYDVEVEIFEGGQPNYHFIIGAE